jgi:hypothetical protein
VRVVECDVTKDDDLARPTETPESEGCLAAMVHSIAFANREDLGRPFVETSRAGFLLAPEVSAYSMLAVVRSRAASAPPFRISLASSCAMSARIQETPALCSAKTRSVSKRPPFPGCIRDAARRALASI